MKVTLYLQDLKYRLLFHDIWMEYFPKDVARIAIQVADTNAQPGRNAHFALDPIRALPTLLTSDSDYRLLVRNAV